MEQTTEKYKIRSATINRIIFAGLLLAVLSFVVVFLFRQRISVLLVNNAQIEMLSIVEQNRMKVDVQIEGFLYSLETIAEDAADKIHAGEPVEGLWRSNQLIASKLNHYGFVDIHGNGLIGPDINMRHFPSIKKSLEGQRKIVYMAQNDFGDTDVAVFSVPVMRDNMVMGSIYATMDMNTLPIIFCDTLNYNEDENFIITTDGMIFGQTMEKGLVKQLGRQFQDWQGSETEESIRSLYTKIRQNKSGVERIILPDGRQVYVACTDIDAVDNLYALDVLPIEVVEARINDILNSITMVTGGLLLVLLLGYGITEMKQAGYQQEIYNLADIDSLTGLENRAKYNKDMQMEVNKYHTSISVVVLDIKGMRIINELLGMPFGDEVIRRVAGILKDNMRGQERCYRGNGSVFYLINWDVDQEEMEKRLVELMEKVKAGDCAQGKYNIQLFAGVYRHAIEKKIVNSGGLNINGIPMDFADELIDNDIHWAENIRTKARAALEQSKTIAKGRICFFDNKLAEKIETEKLLENNFQHALENNEFVLYYQPKYAIIGEKPELHGAEALIRWISPEYGFLSPGRFIPLFERDGNLEILDRHVLKLACRQIRQWLDDGYEAVPISVNVSRRNIVGGDDFLKYALAVLDEYSVPPHLIQLEILETDASVDSKLLIQFLQAFKSNGFSLAMDDFGSGYSSLGMFNSMPIDCLKLDKSFFDSWRPDMPERDSCLIKYMIKAAHDTGRTVVAEGIEEKFQVDLLRQYDCDMIQGYYFSKPLPAEDFASKMHKRV